MDNVIFTHQTILNIRHLAIINVIRSTTLSTCTWNHETKIPYLYRWITDIGFRVGGDTGINYIVVQLHYADKLEGIYLIILTFKRVIKCAMINITLWNIFCAHRHLINIGYCMGCLFVYQTRFFYFVVFKHFTRRRT